jgi:hypothetical protein
VSTRVLRPQYAVAWAALFNFVAFMFFGLHVAKNGGTEIIAAEAINAEVILGNRGRHANDFGCLVGGTNASRCDFVSADRRQSAVGMHTTTRGDQAHVLARAFLSRAMSMA